MCVETIFCLSNYMVTNGCISTFLLLTITLWMLICKYLLDAWVFSFHSFEYIFKCKISWSYDNFTFNVVKNHQIVSHSVISIFISSSNAQGFQFVDILTNIFSTFLFVIVTLRGVLWYFIMGTLLVLCVHVLEDQTQGTVHTLAYSA